MAVMELGMWFIWGNAGSRPLLSWIPPGSGRWDTELICTQLQSGSPSLVRMRWWQGFSLQLLRCFCSLMRGVGWNPPAKDGAAEPSGEPKSLSVCRQASSPLWRVGEHIRPYLGSQNGTQGCAIKKQHLSVKIIFTTSIVEFRQIDLTKPS